jgi:hypothetical protein
VGLKEKLALSKEVKDWVEEVDELETIQKQDM